MSQADFDRNLGTLIRSLYSQFTEGVASFELTKMELLVRFSARVHGEMTGWYYIISRREIEHIESPLRVKRRACSIVDLWKLELVKRERFRADLNRPERQSAR